MNKVRFAVIDDAAFIRELIIANLNTDGHSCVAEAGSIADAIPLVMGTLPDVVFLDLVMPGRNGIDGARMLKDIWPETKIILCTTVDDKSLLERAVDNGVDFIIQKPFEKKELVAALNSVMNDLNKGATP